MHLLELELKKAKRAEQRSAQKHVEKPTDKGPEQAKKVSQSKERAAQKK